MSNKLCVIAGKGLMPRLAIDACIEQNIPYIVISIDGYANIKDSHLLKIGEVEKAIQLMQSAEVKEIVFAGKIDKPNFSKIKLDAVGAKLVAKILKNKFLGDNQILTIVVQFFESYGFKIRGADEICDALIVEKGVLTLLKPSAQDLEYMQHAAFVARELGRLDIGQGVIIEDGVVLAVEGKEGTNQMIARSHHLQQSSNQAILVKMKKPNQERRADLPTIGVDTINYAIEYGIKMIGLEAGGSLIVEKELVIELANKHHIIIYGL